MTRSSLFLFLRSRSFHRLVVPSLTLLARSASTTSNNNIMDINSHKPHKILVLTETNLNVYKEQLPQLIADQSPTTEIFFSDSSCSPEIEHLASECDIWFGTPSLVAPLLSKSRKLSIRRPKWIQSTWAGIEPLLAPDLPRDYILTNMRSIFNTPIAEYTLGHIMAYELNVRHYLKQSKDETKEWKQHVAGSISDKKTIGILGVGEIGSAIAKMAKTTLGMQVYGYTRSSTNCPHVDLYFHHHNNDNGHQGLLDLASCAELDYVVNVMPNTPETRHMLNQEFFSKIRNKNGIVLINAGRGTAISSEQDLLRAIANKQVKYAILDVFEQEPLPKSSRYWNHEQILITSHTAAMTNPQDAAMIFVDNFIKFINNNNQEEEEESKLNYQVNFERGY